jgi:hypothetical protein
MKRIGLPSEGWGKERLCRSAEVRLKDARDVRTGLRIISGYGSDVGWVVYRDEDSINVNRDLKVNMVKLGHGLLHGYATTGRLAHTLHSRRPSTTSTLERTNYQRRNQGLAVYSSIAALINGLDIESYKGAVFAPVNLETYPLLGFKMVYVRRV